MAEYGIFNRKTGEVEENVKLRAERKPKKPRHQFPGGFAFMGLVCISKLADLKLPSQGYQLALRIMEHTEYGGVCLKRPSELARMIETDKARCSKMLKILEDAKVITRLHNRTIIVNPTYFFKGGSVEQAHAIETWSKARGLMLAEAGQRDRIASEAA